MEALIYTKLVCDTGIQDKLTRHEIWKKSFDSSQLKCQYLYF